MSVCRDIVIEALSRKLPPEIVKHLVGEYQQIKTQFLLRRFKPSELDGARFSECILRLLEFLDSGSYTPFGTHLKNTDGICHKALSNTTLPEGVRFFVSRLARILLDIRNKRDVAHVGGEVSPNFADSLLVSQSADWILTEIVRVYHTTTVEKARTIVESINEVRLPIVAEVDDFVRVQATELDTKIKVLVILYHKQPSKVSDSNLARWLRYKNVSRFRSDILNTLDADAMIHYEQGSCRMA
jgi:hypothetical protein